MQAVQRHWPRLCRHGPFHGTPLAAEFGILLNQVAVVADKTRQVATGCSIDAWSRCAPSTVCFSLEDLDLFDRGWVGHAPAQPDELANNQTS